MFHSRPAARPTRPAVPAWRSRDAGVLARPALPKRSSAEHFSVAWWEQRGTALSYRPDIPPQTMTFEGFISDAVEVTDGLSAPTASHSRSTSWGTRGVRTWASSWPAREPGRFHAYIASPSAPPVQIESD